MSPFHTPVAFAFPAGGEDRAADPSSGHFGEVSPEEPEEPWTVVRLGPAHTRAPSLVLMGSRWAVFLVQALQEEWQVPVVRRAQPRYSVQFNLSESGYPGEPAANDGGARMKEVTELLHKRHGV